MDINDKIHRRHLHALGLTIPGTHEKPDESGSQQMQKEVRPGHAQRSSFDVPPIPTRIATTQKEPKPHQRVMDFIHENTDYNVAEFYERFQNDLPKTVIVNQGFCGEIVEDTFDKEQVLRVQAISRQSRVTAKFQYGNYSRLISIPLAYDERLCVVKHGNKLGKPKPMHIIVHENTLPMMVQFPKDHTLTVGNQTISTNNIPCMELMQTFEEVYLLANFITDGVMGQDVVHVPLYLSQLRLALITGIKGQPKEKFAGYEQELDRAANYLEFDQEFGNPNIAEYDPSAIHSDTTYSYVEPRMYTNIIGIVKKHPPPAISNATYSKPTEQTSHEEGPGLYEEIDKTARPPQTANSKQPMQPLNKTVKAGLVNVPTPKPPQEKQNITQQHSTPPSVTQNPGHKAVHTVPPNTYGDQVPSLPARRFVPKIPKPQTEPTKNPHAVYSNDVPRSTITPMPHVKAEPIKENVSPTLPALKEVKCFDDVTKLSIEDVVQYLEKLKLEQYVDEFKNQLIDGAMLQELNIDLLKEDFGMKGVEALRLMKFAKEGHVPN